jgi:histidinol-phosphate aminotransferase
MDITKKISSAVKAGKLYNLDHFHRAWEDQSLRRLMGNELLFPPSPNVIEAVSQILPQMNYYPEDPATNRRLLQALADYAGVAGGADWVTLGNGSMEIIDMLPRTFLDPGDEVLLPCPDYSPYARRPLLYGGVVVDVIPDENFHYTLEDFTSKLTNKTKMIILSRPNAPAGNLLPRTILESLLELDVIVVVDEAYAEFSGENVVDLLSRYNNLIISRTFSKAMGLGGIRLGFVLANPELISFIEHIRVPLNVSLLTQVAAMAALDDTAYIQSNVNKVIQAREYFSQHLMQIPGIQVFPSFGNSVLINSEASGVTAQSLDAHLLQAGFLTRNLSGGRGIPGEYFLRITIGTQDDMRVVANLIRERIALS